MRRLSTRLRNLLAGLPLPALPLLVFCVGGMINACAVNQVPSTGVPPAPITAVATRPIGVWTLAGVVVELDAPGFEQRFAIADQQGRALFPEVPVTITIANLIIRDARFAVYEHAGFALHACPQLDVFTYPMPGANSCWIQAPLLVSQIPPKPTDEQALGANFHFQGLACQTTRFGVLNWFDAALPWLDPQTLEEIFTCKRAAGDTHVIVGLPDGNSLYNEPGNDFSPDRGFGPLDWTDGLRKADGRLADLVIAARSHGFQVWFFSDENGPDLSLKVVLLAIESLQTSKYGDISGQVGAYLPGWDGVFYGWEPSGTVIPGWARAVRAICADCRLGIEFNGGHIPLGEGDGDYKPGGRMQDFQLLLTEFGGDGAPSGGMGHNDTVWQILGRLVTPYFRPADQPAGDDPNPPFILYPMANGAVRYFHAFEFGADEYLWVRHRISKEQVDQDRAYLRALGAKYTG